VASQFSQQKTSMIFMGENFFAKFQPEKDDFHLYKGFSMAQNYQILEILFSNCQIFMKVPVGGQEYRIILIFLTFISGI
jgi:hypothetical protein